MDACLIVRHLCSKVMCVGFTVAMFVQQTQHDILPCTCDLYINSNRFLLDLHMDLTHIAGALAMRGSLFFPGLSSLCTTAGPSPKESAELQIGLAGLQVAFCSLLCIIPASRHTSRFT